MLSATSGDVRRHSLMTQRQSVSGMVKRVPSICHIFHDTISATFIMVGSFGRRPHLLA